MREENKITMRAVGCKSRPSFSSTTNRIALRTPCPPQFQNHCSVEEYSWILSWSWEVFFKHVYFKTALPLQKNTFYTMLKFHMLFKSTLPVQFKFKKTTFFQRCPIILKYLTKCTQRPFIYTQEKWSYPSANSSNSSETSGCQLWFCMASDFLLWCPAYRSSRKHPLLALSNNYEAGTLHFPNKKDKSYHAGA